MSSNVARRLRPYLFNGSERIPPRRTFTLIHAHHKQDDTKSVTHDYQKRIAELEARRPLSECYPRLNKSNARNIVALVKFRRDWAHLEADQTEENDGLVTVAGRVKSIRTAGNKLVFMDLDDNTGSTQVLCKYGQLQETGVDVKQFKDFSKLARKGDWYTAIGLPHKTGRGELSVLATQLPTLVSPSLHQIPEVLDDPETRARHRHIDMLVNRESTKPLLVRHHVEKQLSHFFHEHDFIKVNTPLLTHGAGGAVARPFETVATELEGQQLNLRVAPELWLKRLVVGGVTKVYEIGPAFRNEGVDATHNPEFTICEFYEAFATIEDLMQKTESLLSSMQKAFDVLKGSTLTGLPNLDIDLFGPFERLEFLPSLERQIGQPMPDFSAPEAQQQTVEVFHQKNIPLPANPTLPRLLDALAGHYLEPLCHKPTFIINHPACLSPLSKHFPCPTTNQAVAARAELFIKGKEYANMYEEENSPFEQRRKFQDQLQYRQVDGESDGKAVVDDSYIQALEWGLPPTGGWGCGVDRLVMLLSGRERIADVLPFGTVRNVVALGRGKG